MILQLSTRENRFGAKTADLGGLNLQAAMVCLVRQSGTIVFYIAVPLGLYS